MGLKASLNLIKPVLQKAKYITPACELRTAEQLGLKMEQLTGDVVQFSKRILKKPTTEQLSILLQEHGLSTKHICDNNSLFLEELITRFPIKAGEKANYALEDIMIYLEDINHAKYTDKLSFLDEFLANVKKVENLTDIDGKLLYNSANKLYTKKAILQAQYNNPERYQDIMNLYKLHKEGKAPRYVLETLFPESTFHHLPKSDMQKLLRGENYYPQLKSLSDSLVSKLETGEAFSVGNDMFVKTVNGYEKLKIDAKTYEKLFPPIERYALAQGPLGNCHLIAAMDSIIKNPEGRIEFYRMFETVEGGKAVKCTISGYKDSGIVYKFDNLKNLHGENNLKGSLGHKMIEDTYAQNYYIEAINSPISGWRVEEMTHGEPLRIFDCPGDYENVAEHISCLIGKNTKTIYHKIGTNFEESIIINAKNEQKGIGVVNCLSENQNKGLFHGHFYNADLSNNKTINPWNTMEEIHYSPFKLEDVTYIS